MYPELTPLVEGRADTEPGGRRKTERLGGWIQTFTGGKFYLLDPRPDEIHILDIAHALSQVNRFAGHTIFPYSVALHSVLLSNHVDRVASAGDALWALLRDAPVAYLSDVPTPLKAMFPSYEAIETRLMAAVCERFSLPLPMPESVRTADAQLLSTEHREVMRPGLVWETDRVEPVECSIWEWSADEAKHSFLRTFKILTSG